MLSYIEIINILLLIMFAILFLLNTYQSILDLYSPNKVGVMIYYFHRMLVGFNLFTFGNYVLICSKLIYFDAVILIADIFVDVAVLFGYCAVMILAYQTTLSYQLAFKMKIDVEESSFVYYLHVIIFLLQVISLVIQKILSSIYNTTLYSGFYLIVTALVLGFIIFYSWYSFFNLNSALRNIQSKLNAGLSKNNEGGGSGTLTDSTSTQLLAFKQFLTILTVGLILLLIGQCYFASTYFINPLVFFDASRVEAISLLAIMCFILSFFCTFNFWKSVDASVSPESVMNKPSSQNNKNRTASNYKTSRLGDLESVTQDEIA